MIYVDRSSVPVPAILISPHANAEREKIEKLLMGSKEHLAQTRIRFDSDIWMRTRSDLFDLFHGKCAYCETPILRANMADVEHFRPRDGVIHADGTSTHYYYSWLAYDWDNLLLVCDTCITAIGKRSVFPVMGNRARLLASVEECRKVEDYGLLDPCFDRPEQHLTFDETGRCKPLSKRGDFTIYRLALNRPDLVHARNSKWKEIKDRLMLFRMLDPGKDLDASAPPEEIVSPEQPYAAVARAAFADAVRTQDRKIESITVDTSEQMEEIPRSRTRYGDRKELPPQCQKLIRRIEIKNFKGIESLDFKLRKRSSEDHDGAPMLMLLGENSTGKSSVLEAVALALLGTDETSRLGLNAQSFLRRPSLAESAEPPTKPAEVTIYFDDEGEPVRLRIDPEAGKFEGNPERATVLLGYGPRRFFSGQRRVRSDNPSARVRTLFDPVAVIGNPTSWLMNCKDTDFNAAMRALRELLLMAEEALVTRPPRGKRRGKEIMFEIQGDPEPLRRLSEGYKTIVATSVDIMREMLEYWPDLESARGVVLIDELETHLHPRWKMRIVGRLREAMPRVQFIATTHDPLCLRGLGDGEVEVLRRDQSGKIERVTGLPNVRGLSVEQLLTSEFFGLFSSEDPKFEEDMGRYVALSTKHQLTTDEQTQLEHYRNLLQETITLGATPQRRLVQDAAREYLLEQRQKPQTQNTELRQAAVKKIVDLWNALPAEDTEQ